MVVMKWTQNRSTEMMISIHSQIKQILTKLCPDSYNYIIQLQHFYYFWNESNLFSP